MTGSRVLSKSGAKQQQHANNKVTARAERILFFFLPKAGKNREKKIAYIQYKHKKQDKQKQNPYKTSLKNMQFPRHFLETCREVDQKRNKTQTKME